MNEDVAAMCNSSAFITFGAHFKRRQEKRDLSQKSKLEAGIVPYRNDKESVGWLFLPPWLA